VDISTFYALFSATCFTLVGLWWEVSQGHEEWMRDPQLRRMVGGIYISFLLPGLMGLFAQVGGTENPEIWRASFVALALIGCVSMLRLTGRTRPDGSSRFLRLVQAVAAACYALIAVVGARPELADRVNLKPIQAEAILLILLVVLGHGLAWRFMSGEGRPVEEHQPDV
jgi:hypothetical protein